MWIRLIIVAFSLIFLLGMILGMSTPSHAAGTVRAQTAGIAFVNAWKNNASSLSSIGVSLTVAVSTTASEQVVVFAHVCWSGGSGNPLLVSDSGGSVYTIRAQLTNASLPCTIMGAIAYTPIASSSVTVSWFNVGGNSHYAGVGVFAYTGVSSSTAVTSISRTFTGVSMMNLSLSTTVADSWMAGYGQLIGGCDSGGNYPTIGPNFPPIIVQSRVHFNADPNYNECFTGGDTNGTVPLGSNYMTWSSFTLNPIENGVLFELSPPVIPNPTEWINPTANASTPGFFDWIPPMIAFIGGGLMIGAVIAAGLKFLGDVSD